MEDVSQGAQHAEEPAPAQQDEDRQAFGAAVELFPGPAGPPAVETRYAEGYEVDPSENGTENVFLR